MNSNNLNPRNNFSKKDYAKNDNKNYDRNYRDRNYKHDNKHCYRNDNKYDSKYDDAYDRRHHKNSYRSSARKYDDAYNEKIEKKRHDERKNSPKNIEKNYNSKNGTEYYDKYRNGNYEKDKKVKRGRSDSITTNDCLYDKNRWNRNEGKGSEHMKYENKSFYRNKEEKRDKTSRYEHKSIYRKKEERRKSNMDDDGDSDDVEYSSESNGRYNKNNRKKKRFSNYEEDYASYVNDHTKKIKNANDVLEKKTNIELSRFTFIYKIPNNITEEEIDEIIGNIAINNAFSLPTNIYINKLSYFSIKDELFVKENLEFLKNNSFFNHIQQNMLSSNADYIINDDNCCIIEFPSNEACGKLFSLFEKDRCIEIKSAICYIFPIFKLKKRNQNNEEKQQIKKFNDWYCSYCNFLNFSRRTMCYFCKAAKTPFFNVVESDTKNINNFIKSNLNNLDSLQLKNNFNFNNNQHIFNDYSIDSYKDYHGYGNNISNLKANHGDVTNDEIVNFKNNNNSNGNDNGNDNNHCSNNNIENRNSDHVLNARNEPFSLNGKHSNDYNIYSYNPFHIFNNHIESIKTTKKVLLNEEKTSMLILKDLCGSMNDKDIIKFLSIFLKKYKVDYLYLFNDQTRSNQRKGFCFIEFSNINQSEEMMSDLEGNYYINFENNYLKIDYVHKNEKQCFINCLKLAQLNIDKSSATVYKDYIPYFNFFVNHFEMVTNNDILHYTFF